MIKKISNNTDNQSISIINRAKERKKIINKFSITMNKKYLLTHKNQFKDKKIKELTTKH